MPVAGLGRVGSGPGWPFRAAVTALSYSRAGALLAGAQDGRLARWDLRGQPIALESAQQAQIRCFATGPAGRWAAADTAGVIQVSMPGEPRRLLLGHTASVRDLSFSPRGTRLASASEDATARVWDLPTGVCRAILRGHLTQLCDVRFSPDDQIIATGSYDGFAMLWDATTGALRHKLPHEYRVEQLVFSPDGATLVTGTGDLWSPGASRLRWWSVATGELRAEVTLPSGEYLTALRGDGEAVVAQTSAGRLSAWSPAGEPLPRGPAELRVAQPGLAVLPLPGAQPEVRRGEAGPSFRLRLEP